MMKSLAQTEPLSPEKHIEEIDCQIIHTTNGRLRMKIPRLSRDIKYASQLNLLIESFDFIISVRINPAAESLIIHYQEHLVSSATVQESLLTTIKQAAIIETPSDIAPSAKEYKTSIGWAIERVGMPVFSLALAVMAQQMLPVPPLLVAGVVAIAAIPFIQRTVDMMLEERRLYPTYNTQVVTFKIILNKQFWKDKILLWYCTHYEQKLSLI